MIRRYKIIYPGSEATMKEFMIDEKLSGSISHEMTEHILGYPSGSADPLVYKTEAVQVIFNLDDEQLEQIKKDHPSIEFQEIT